MRYGFLIWTICLLLSLRNANGQAGDGYLFRHITQLDGLVNNKVYSIVQDSRGFIWIGTENGLQRYDGSRFVTYQDELSPGNKSHIQTGSIDIIRNSQLFISLNKKLNLLTNTFSTYTKKDLLESIADTNAVFQGSGDTLWITGSRYAYACKGNKISVYSMVKDSINNKVWVVPDQGLLLLDRATKKVYSTINNPMHDTLLTMAGSIGAKGMMIDSRRNIWINPWTHRFYQYDVHTKKLKNYSLLSLKLATNADAPLLVNQVFEDNHHNIWLATSNAGLLQYNREKDSFTAITASPDNSRGIQYNFEVFCIFQDKEENIWLGTDKGINIFNPYHQYFQVIRNEPNTTSTLPRREINDAIQTGQGDILVGTWGGGVAVYNSQWQFKRRISFPGRFEENLVWCFMENTDGKIWIGCQHGYLHIYDPYTGKLSTLHPEALENSTIRCMKKDHNGNILFGLHNGGIAMWDKSKEIFYAYADATAITRGGFTSVFNILIDHNNKCWAATDNGLKLFDSNKRIFTNVYYPGRSNSYACRGLAEENDTTLLVGILNGGLATFHTKTKTFSFPQAGDKLASSTVHAIQKDSAGNTWFTTDYNLYKFNSKQNKYVSYATEPGVINSAFESTDFVALQNGRWLITTFTEVLCFHPDSLSNKSNTSLPVEITGVKLFDKSLFVDSFVYKNRPMEFLNKQNFLTIEFGTLHFSNLRQIKYSYKLQGVNRDWVNTDAPSASYTNLAPGDYTFYVVADDEGNKSQPTVFRFAIAPRFWQTWWFRLAILVLAVSLIYIIVKRRVVVIRRELALKRQMQEAEMMALRAQMNPHFIFNCINSIDALIQSNDKYQATIYLNKFAKLLRNILDSSKENTVPLVKDLETLELYIQLEQFRNDNLFTYEIRTGAGLFAYDIRVPPLIVQPYVENAILHGLRYRNDNTGKLLVDVRQENGQLLYTVEDNGIGRELSGKLRTGDKKSYGMDMSYDRIKLFNKEYRTSVEITDLQDNGQPAGTRVTVDLKID